jgi:hypothetical protein
MGDEGVGQFNQSLLPCATSSRCCGWRQDLANSLVVSGSHTRGLPVQRLSGHLSGSNPYTTRWDVNDSSRCGWIRRGDTVHVVPTRLAQAVGSTLTRREPAETGVPPPTVSHANRSG